MPISNGRYMTVVQTKSGDFKNVIRSRRNAAPSTPENIVLSQGSQLFGSPRITRHRIAEKTPAASVTFDTATASAASTATSASTPSSNVEELTDEFSKKLDVSGGGDEQEATSTVSMNSPSPRSSSKGQSTPVRRSPRVKAASLSPLRRGAYIKTD